MNKVEFITEALPFEVGPAIKEYLGFSVVKWVAYFNLSKTQMVVSDAITSGNSPTVKVMAKMRKLEVFKQFFALGEDFDDPCRDSPVSEIAGRQEKIDEILQEGVQLLNDFVDNVILNNK